jgi:hypothetical protein
MRGLLISFGVLLIILGLAWPWMTRLGLGHLPGDIRIERPGFGFYFPLTTGLLVSVVLSVLLTLVSWFWRR